MGFRYPLANRRKSGSWGPARWVMGKPGGADAPGDPTPRSFHERTYFATIEVPNMRTGDSSNWRMSGNRGLRYF